MLGKITNLVSDVVKANEILSAAKLQLVDWPYPDLEKYCSFFELSLDFFNDMKSHSTGRDKLYNMVITRIALDIMMAGTDNTFDEEEFDAKQFEKEMAENQLIRNLHSVNIGWVRQGIPKDKRILVGCNQCRMEIRTAFRIDEETKKRRDLVEVQIWTAWDFIGE